MGFVGFENNDHLTGASDSDFIGFVLVKKGSSYKGSSKGSFKSSVLIKSGYGFRARVYGQRLRCYLTDSCQDWLGVR